jgi:uncharacterized OB-fold protein
MSIIIKKCKKCGRYDMPECPFCLEKYVIFPLEDIAHCFYCGRSVKVEWEEEE